MRKTAIFLSLMLLLTALSTTDAFADRRRHSETPHFMTFSFVINPLGLGYKHHLGNRFYWTGDLGYRNTTSDLEMRTGAAYLFPVKILIFRFYGGGGLQFSRNDGYQYPYLVVGTNFLFLYSELIHPMENRADPEYRLGFSLKF